MAASKKGGAKMASDAERIDQESGVDQEQENPNAISVRIDKLFNDDSQKLKAIASITVGEFAVHGFKVWEQSLYFHAPELPQGRGRKNGLR